MTWRTRDSDSEGIATSVLVGLGGRFVAVGEYVGFGGLVVGPAVVQPTNVMASRNRNGEMCLMDIMAIL
jgi:hypothetical protein